MHTVGSAIQVRVLGDESDAGVESREQHARGTASRPQPFGHGERGRMVREQHIRPGGDCSGDGGGRRIESDEDAGDLPLRVAGEQADAVPLLGPLLGKRGA